MSGTAELSPMATEFRNPSVGVLLHFMLTEVPWRWFRLAGDEQAALAAMPRTGRYGVVTCYES